MFFCSKYGYDYGFNGSDKESVEDEADDQSLSKTVKRKMRKGDTNIIVVKFDDLKLASEFSKICDRKPIYCSNCGAILSLYRKKSVKYNEDDSNKLIIWTCDFCYEKTNISSMIDNLDDIPNYEDVSFIYEPNEIKDNQNTINTKYFDDSYLIFCIDVSGSMETYIESTDDIKLNRLDAIKKSCIENLNELKLTNPNRRVALVVFSDTVKYYGDGSHANEIITIGRNVDYSSTNIRLARNSIVNSLVPSNHPIFDTDLDQFSENVNNDEDVNYLDDEERMLDLGVNHDHIISPLSKSCFDLEHKIKNLKIEGSTALGPALLFSIGLCSKKSGSQIILCTDGFGNRGIGSIEVNQFGLVVNAKEVDSFYEKISDYAKEKGIQINVITMEGTDCKLALLGKVCVKTNGLLRIVNHNNFSLHVKSILEKRIIATCVKVKLIVNYKYLYIRSEEYDTNEAETASQATLNEMKKSIIEKYVGNVYEDTLVTFEFGIRKFSHDEFHSLEKYHLDELPFQIQVTYNRPDGLKCLMVYTKNLRFTRDRKKAEMGSNMNKRFIYANAAQKIKNSMICSNLSTAKFRLRQLKNMESVNNWITPNDYKSKSKIVEMMSKKACDMNDEEAEQIYN